MPQVGEVGHTIDRRISSDVALNKHMLASCSCSCHVVAKDRPVNDDIIASFSHVCGRGGFAESVYGTCTMTSFKFYVITYW